MEQSRIISPTFEVLPHQKPVSNVTVKNYKTLAAASKYAEIQQKISHKTRTRHIAENSIMSAVSLLMTIATTH